MTYQNSRFNGLTLIVAMLVLLALACGSNSQARKVGETNNGDTQAVAPTQPPEVAPTVAPPQNFKVGDISRLTG